MAALESEVQPVMTPLLYARSKVLTVSDQQLLTRWFVKTLVMYDCAAEKMREPYFNSNERQTLAKQVLIPRDTMVFLSSYKGQYAVITRETNLPITFDYPTPSGNASSLVRGYAATFAIKHLVLQLFSVRRPSELAFANLGFDVKRIANTDIQIWPAKQSVNWPPPAYLTDPGFEFFAERWLNMITL
jgi:hypothetical protein